MVSAGFLKIMSHICHKQASKASVHHPTEASTKSRGRGFQYERGGMLVVLLTGVNFGLGKMP